MVRLIRKKPKDSGLAPGTLVFTGEQRVETVRITLIDYDAGRVKRRGVQAIEEKATFELFQKAFCRVDWRLFDPYQLAWRFHGAAYEDALKRLR